MANYYSQNILQREEVDVTSDEEDIIPYSQPFPAKVERRRLEAEKGKLIRIRIYKF